MIFFFFVRFLPSPSLTANGLTVFNVFLFSFIQFRQASQLARVLTQLQFKICAKINTHFIFIPFSSFLLNVCVKYKFTRDRRGSERSERTECHLIINIIVANNANFESFKEKGLFVWHFVFVISIHFVKSMLASRAHMLPAHICWRKQALCMRCATQTK